MGERRGRRIGGLLAPAAGGAMLCLLPLAGARADCAPSNAARICLFGTTTAPNYAAALVEASGAHAPLLLRLGDKIAGWSIGEIGPSYVVLTQGGRKLRITLPDSTAAAPAAADGAMLRRNR